MTWSHENAMSLMIWKTDVEFFLRPKAKGQTARLAMIGSNCRIPSPHIYVSVCFEERGI